MKYPVILRGDKVINVEKRSNTMIRCKDCGYRWTYTGISYSAKCPRCSRYTRVKEDRKNRDQKRRTIKK